MGVFQKFFWKRQETVRQVSPQLQAFPDDCDNLWPDINRFSLDNVGGYYPRAESMCARSIWNSRTRAILLGRLLVKTVERRLSRRRNTATTSCWGQAPLSPRTEL